MWRALVIGSGWSRHAARCFAEDSRTSIVGIVGRGSDRTRRLATSMGTPVFFSLAEALGTVRPQIAALAVSEHAHFEMVKTLLESGCHVLCSHPVARDAAAVRALQSLARARGLLAATDYTLPLCPAFEAGGSPSARSGPPLRLAIRSPSADLIAGIDLAVRIAGPVQRVFASTRYPDSVERRRAPQSDTFPPTALLDHAGGCVTTLVPISQASPSTAHRIEISGERERIDIELPAGNARRIALHRSGHVTNEELCAAPATITSSEELVGAAMRRLVERYLDAVDSSAALHAPLSDEYHLRVVWAALQRSAHLSRPTLVRGAER